MKDIDRQIQALLQTLVALQGAKIIELEREVRDLRARNAEFARRELDRAKRTLTKVEVQA